MAANSNDLDARYQRAVQRLDNLSATANTRGLYRSPVDEEEEEKPKTVKPRSVEEIDAYLRGEVTYPDRNVYGFQYPERVVEEPVEEERGALNNTMRGIGERAAELGGNLLTAGGRLADTLDSDSNDAMIVWGAPDGGFLGTGLGIMSRGEFETQGGVEATPLQSAARAWKDLDLGYVASEGWEQGKQDFANGDVINGVGNMLAWGLETGTVSLPDMAAAIVNPPAYIASRSNEIAEERARSDGRSTEDLQTSDLIVGTTAAVAVTVLERFGAQQLLKIPEKTSGGIINGLLSGARRGAGYEGLTELQQETLEYLAEKAGTEEGATFLGAVERSLQGLVGGGTFGSVAGGAQGAVGGLRSGNTTEVGADGQTDLLATQTPKTAQQIVDEQTKQPTRSLQEIINEQTNVTSAPTKAETKAREADFQAALTDDTGLRVNDENQIERSETASERLDRWLRENAPEPAPPTPPYQAPRTTQEQVDLLTGVSQQGLGSTEADVKAAFGESTGQYVPGENQLETELRAGDLMALRAEARIEPVAPKGLGYMPTFRVVFPDGSVSEVNEQTLAGIINAQNEYATTAQQGDSRAAVELPRVNAEEVIAQLLRSPEMTIQQVIDQQTGVSREVKNTTPKNVRAAANEGSGQFVNSENQIEREVDMGEVYQEIATPKQPNKAALRKSDQKWYENSVFNKSAEDLKALLGRARSNVRKGIIESEIKFREYTDAEKNTQPKLTQEQKNQQWYETEVKGKSIEELNQLEDNKLGKARADILIKEIALREQEAAAAPSTPVEPTQAAEATPAVEENAKVADAPTTEYSMAERIKNALPKQAKKQRAFVDTIVENPALLDMEAKDAAKAIGVSEESFSRMKKNLQENIVKMAQAEGVSAPELYRQFADSMRSDVDTDLTRDQEIKRDLGYGAGEMDSEALNARETSDGVTTENVSMGIVRDTKETQDRQSKTKAEREADKSLNEQEQAEAKAEAESTSKAQKVWNKTRKAMSKEDRAKSVTWDELSGDNQQDFTALIDSGIDADMTVMVLAASETNMTAANEETMTEEENASLQEIEALNEGAAALYEMINKGDSYDALTNVEKEAAREAYEFIKGQNALDEIVKQPKMYRDIMDHFIKQDDFYKRNGDTVSGNSAGDVRKWAKNVTDKLAEWVNVEVVQSVEDLPGIHPSDVAGAVIDGKVYVVADNINSKSEARVTLAHEVIGHIGMERVLGKEGFQKLTDKITQLRKSGDKTINRIVDDLRTKYVNANGEYMLNDEQEAREVIAHFIEAKPNYGLVRTVLNKIKQFLAKYGMADATSAEIEAIAIKAAKLTRTELSSADFNTTMKDAYQRLGKFVDWQTQFDNIVEQMYGKDSDLELSHKLLSANADIIADKLERMNTYVDVPDGRGGFTRINTDGPRAVAETLRAYRQENPADVMPRAYIMPPFLTSGGRIAGFDVDQMVYIGANNRGDASFYYIDQQIGESQGQIFIAINYDTNVLSDGDTAFSFYVMPVELYMADREAIPMGQEVILQGYLDMDTAADAMTVAIDGPVLDGVAHRWMNSTDPKVVTTHDFEAGTDFQGEKYARTNMGTKAINGFLKAAIRHASVEGRNVYVPDLNWHRSTGINPYGSEKTGGKAPKDLKSDIVEAMYRRRGMPETLYDKARNVAKSAFGGKLYEYIKDGKLGAQSLHALNENYGGELKSLGKFYKTALMMEQMQQELANNGHKVAMAFKALPTVQADKVADLMYRATRINKAPDVEGSPLAKEWAALSPEAQRVYQDARTKLRADWTQRMNTFVRMTKEAYAAEIAKAKDQKSKDELTRQRDRVLRKADGNIKLAERKEYFPLIRHGDFIAVYKSQEYIDLENKIEDATGAPRREMERKLAQMTASTKHYRVRAEETQAAIEQDIDQWGSKYASVASRLSVRTDAMNHDASAGAFQVIRNHLQEVLTDAKLSEEIGKILTELEIQRLPENHSLKRTLERKNVAGASTDMLRSFASTVESNAFYLSRMQHAKDLANTLYDMGQESAEGGNSFDTGRVVREIRKRRDLDMKYTETPIQNALARVSGMYHLVSPSYWTVNASQPWFIGAPVMDARYPGKNAAKKLGKASVEGMKLANSVIKEGGVFADLDVNTKDAKGEYLIKSKEERELLSDLIKHGRIDINITSDLGVMARGETGALSTVTRYSMWPAHQVEIVNRVAVALATYRMAKASGESHTKAMASADKMIVDTQIDYSDVNAPRFMKREAMPLSRLVFQFRKYQHAMAQLLIMNAQKAYKGDKVAQRTLRNMVAVQVATAGVLGIPGVNTLMWIADLFGDDDEPDVRTEIRNWLAEEMGPDAARAVMKGPLGYALDTDLTRRTGLGDVFSPMPFLRTGAESGIEGLGNVLVAAGGAPMGMLANLYEAELAMERGDYVGMVEKAMPKAIKDVLKAWRYSEEGIETRSGTRGTDPNAFDEWDVALRALGFSPMKESEYYEARTASVKVEKGVNDAKSRILKAFVEAWRDKDTAARGEVMDEVREFNKKHPKYRITRGSLERAVRGRLTTERDTIRPETGLGTRNKNLEGLDTFAR